MAKISGKPAARKGDDDLPARNIWPVARYGVELRNGHVLMNGDMPMLFVTRGGARLYRSEYRRDAPDLMRGANIVVFSVAWLGFA